MKELIDICKEIIDNLDWEKDYFEYGTFQEILNEKIKTNLNKNNILNQYNVIDKYDVITIRETEWKDDGDGKYFFQNITYQLVKYDDSCYEYVTDSNIIEKLNIYFNLPITKTGSYYTDWFYEYDKPIMMQKKIIHVPEKIIPAHDEEKMERI